MKALHDITAPDPWAGFFNPDAARWNFADYVAPTRTQANEVWRRVRDEMLRAPLTTYRPADYQRQYLEGTFAQDPRPRDVYFYEPAERWRGYWDAANPLDQRPQEPLNTRDVAARLTADDAALRQANLPDRFALTATRAEVRALTQAGYLYEGAELQFRGRHIAITG